MFEKYKISMYVYLGYNYLDIRPNIAQYNTLLKYFTNETVLF